MYSEPAVFENRNNSLISKYGLAVGFACFGFWFFDYVMRGWFGGTPSLAVSLRHTFIIAICLIFVVGFLVKDQFQKIRLSPDGLELQDAAGQSVKMAWSEIVEASVEANRVVLRGNSGQTTSFSARLADPEGFVKAVETFAGSDHVLAAAVMKAVKI